MFVYGSCIIFGSCVIAVFTCYWTVTVQPLVCNYSINVLKKKTSEILGLFVSAAVPLLSSSYTYFGKFHVKVILEHLEWILV